MKKRILVTGGAGFIGSHLCDRLVDRGDDVLCLDNFFSGAKDNIRHLLARPNFELVRHDLTYPYLAEVDEIYNLACPASPIHYQSNPVKTIKTNVLGAIHMLGLAKRVKAKILQASTSEVYGDPHVHPQREDYWGYVNPIGVRACYDEGKRCAETLFFDYHRQNRVNIRVARIFNVYGPRMHPDDGRVVSNFIIQALKSRDLTVYGDGSQTRSFCYVDDLVEGLLLFMAAPDDCIGQSRRDLRFRTGRPNHRLDRISVESDPRSASPRRPQAAQARYFPGSRQVRLGAEGRSDRGTEEDGPVF
jgi:UDP-glucuronate decarboxylase